MSREAAILWLIDWLLNLRSERVQPIFDHVISDSSTAVITDLINFLIEFLRPITYRSKASLIVIARWLTDLIGSKIL